MPGRRPTVTGARLRTWNRALHNYLGLYLLCFIWLFAASGVLLNHPTWAFAQFWPSRQVTTAEHALRVPGAGDDLARARDVMAQLDLAGEVQRFRVLAADDGEHLDLQVLKAGRITDVDVDVAAGRARVQRTQTNLWGVVHWLHTFTGVRLGQPELQRDWALTRLWSLAMDAVCAGLVVLVVSGLVMWYPQWRRLPLAWACLAAGVAACGLFVFGLSWIY